MKSDANVAYGAGFEKADEAARQRNTADLIIDVISAMSEDLGYHDEISRVLEVLERAIHADRLYVLEQQRRLDGRVFERCADGVAPRMESVRAVSDKMLSAFVDHFKGCDVIYAETIDELGLTNPRMVAYFERFGIESELAVPLRVNGRTVGCLGADNYSLDEGVDIDRLFDAVAPLLATTISNQQFHEELEWTSTHDPLTGLLNRRGAEAELKRRFGNGAETPFALALVDIDDFKVKNDLYGHAAGDEALKVVAETIRDAFPEGSILGRNGGDEMIVAVGPERAEEADELFARLAQTEMTFGTDTGTAELTVSVGYTACPELADSLSSAYAQADTALYAVKLAGKSSAMRHSPTLGLQYRSQLGFTPHDIAENIPGAIMVHRMQPDGEILFSNDKMIELLECESLADFMEFTGMDYRQIMHPDDVERVHRDAAVQLGAYEIGALFSVDYRILTKKGNVKTVAVNGHLVEGADGEKVFYALIIEAKGHRFPTP